MKKRKISFTILAFLGSFLLTSCDMKRYGQEVADAVIDGLIPNFWAFLVQLIALLILIGGVFVLGYKPLKKYLDERSETIDKEVKSAQKNNVEAQQNFAESEKRIAESKKRAVQIVEEAKTNANLERESILNEAENEALYIRNKTKLDIEKQKLAAQQEIKEEIVNVALDASKQILEREINEKDDQKIVENFLDEIEKDK